MASIIGKIKHPQTALLGESIEVEILGRNNKSLEDSDDVSVRLNGVTGARQFLQFASSGEHEVVILATSQGARGRVQRESRTITITVVEAREADGMPGTRALLAPAQASPPILRTVPFANQPYEVGFALGMPSFLQSVTSPTLEPPGGSVPVVDTPSVAAPALRALTAAEAGERYDWDFGDGTVITTAGPYVQYNFEESLKPQREQQSFHVAVTVTPGDGAPYTVRRTLSVVNAYALCKRFGTIVPRVYSEAFARRVPGGYEAVLAIKNVESFPLTLRTRRVQPMLACDALGQLHPPESLEPPLEVPAGTAAFVAVTLTNAQVPEGTLSFTVHLLGDAEGGALPVRVEAVFDLSPQAQTFQGLAFHEAPAASPEPTSRQLGDETTPAKVRLLDTYPSSDLGGALAGRFDQTLGVLREGEPLTQAPEAGLRQLGALDGGGCREGEVCDPTTASPSGDCRCLYTTDTQRVTVPARFTNARKGDIILLAGSVNSLVGNMLRRVTPPQYYDHCVMITKDPLATPIAGPNHEALNTQEITHNTVCFERFLDPTYWIGAIWGRPFPTQGLREDVVRYIWPGVITQTTHQAVRGEKRQDPETGKMYDISAINPKSHLVERQGHWEIIPPLVIKPDPLEETPAIRAQLHKLADYARAQTGKGHYRLYGYSDAEIADVPAPKEAGWAAGSIGTMCSSFIWDVARKHMVHLEGELEKEDKKAGAVVKPGTPDGLYHYDKEERLAAGEYVADYIRSEVLQAAEEMVSGARRLPVVVKAAQNVANQIANTFASDTAGQEGLDEAWRRPDEGTTVSPDDLLFWDPPRLGGVYGYCAPALYRDSYEASLSVYRWMRVQGRGSLNGTVRYQGKPVEQATVAIPGLPTQYSDRDGGYRFDALSVGTHELMAMKNIGGLMRVAYETAHVVTAKNEHDVDLRSTWRKLVVSGRVAAGKQTKSLPLDYSISLGSVSPHAERTFEIPDLGGARLELRLAANWHPNQSLALTLAYTFSKEGVTYADNRSFTLTPGRTATIASWGSSAVGLLIDMTLENADT